MSGDYPTGTSMAMGNNIIPILLFMQSDKSNHDKVTQNYSNNIIMLIMNDL